MSAIHTLITTTQVTFTQPPPAGAVQVQIPNQQLQEVVTVTAATVDNPGTNQTAMASSFPYGLSDVYSVNPNLSQFYPVNAPPKP